MNAKELFNKYANWEYSQKVGIPLMDDKQFTAALAEAMCCGQVQPVVSQPGDDGSGGPKNTGEVSDPYVKGWIKNSIENLQHLSESVGPYLKEEYREKFYFEINEVISRLGGASF